MEIKNHVVVSQKFYASRTRMFHMDDLLMPNVGLAIELNMCLLISTLGILVDNASRSSTRSNRPKTLRYLRDLCSTSVKRENLIL